MTLANGREFVLIPGPSILPDRVLNAMHRAAMDIYAGPMLDVTDDCQRGLKRIFNTECDTYIYAANGHGVWEASLTNLFSIGDKLLVLESGTLRHRLGANLAPHSVSMSEVLPCDWHSAIDLDAVEERLRRDGGQEIKAILAVQVDTASGVVNDIGALRRRDRRRRTRRVADDRRGGVARHHAFRLRPLGASMWRSPLRRKV